MKELALKFSILFDFFDKEYGKSLLLDLQLQLIHIEFNCDFYLWI